MLRKALVFTPAFFLLLYPAMAQNEPDSGPIACRVMEVVTAGRLGVTAIVFHQRDKADGPRLGKFLLAHSGAEAEFETRDGQRHRATIVRLKSCFGRGLLIFPSSEAKLAEKEEFVLLSQGEHSTERP